jgi:hypothetical protein
MKSAPARLRALQEAFGSAVRAPYDFEGERFDGGGDALAPGLEADLLPRGPLRGRDRLVVYNRQYWYRLFTILQEEFPLLAHALTYPVFNRLASAYLTRHPSRAPYLDALGDRLPDFVRADTRWNDPRTAQIARLDQAFNRAFHAPAAPPPRTETLAAAGGPRLRLQPHVTVLEEDWNLMTRRGLCLDAEEDFVPRFVKRKGYWVVYRNVEGGVAPQRLDRVRFRLLGALSEGEALEAACARAAEGLAPPALDRLAKQLPRWFAEWTTLGWFTQ